jgi:microcystin-dependent protein
MPLRAISRAEPRRVTTASIDVLQTNPDANTQKAISNEIAFCIRVRIQMTLYKWSQIPASDATADPTINWAEGQPPSSVNDSGRAMMAATAKYRDDIAGAIVTGGTSSNYTVSSYEVFDTFAHLNGQMIAFTPHVTNSTGPVTLNVDSLGAKALRSAPNADLLAGVLVQGTPYAATYNNGDGAWYLQNFYGNPYNIPLGGMLDFIGAAAPNSSFVLPFGQAISRTTYVSLFAMVGTTYGAGDGTTTFNIPDLRGRVTAGKDDMGGSMASRLSGTSITTGGATTLGGTGGAETKTLATANLPPYAPSGSVAGTLNAGSIDGIVTPGSTVGVGGTSSGGTGAALNGLSIAASFTGNAQGGTSTPFALTQPTIILNKILRVI